MNCKYLLVYRQREFFDHHKEKRRRKDFGEDPGKVHTLADYIRQNLRGGESLDILGLRSLNPTTAAYSDASLPDPATGLPFTFYIKVLVPHTECIHPASLSALQYVNPRNRISCSREVKD